MLFNSIDFAIFLPLVFLIYWLIGAKNVKKQNLFLIFSSYLFYAWWDWRFLVLILFSTLVDFSIGKKIDETSLKAKKKQLLLVSLFVNLGLLGVFKYFNFFVENFTQVFSFFGQHFETSSLNIILPVGISFYTFQTLSYTIDIYRGKIKPTNDLISFGVFVSFFPQLVAGPIERASNLLPQFLNKRNFNYESAKDGLRQILWGLFKKVVIADNCATYVNIIFDNPANYNSSTLFLGGVLFAFQIYGDFSGYSDIAIGTSKLFGIKLSQNFAFPYFSRDIAEFWRRWHISLSTWFRDYLYIPLGGSKGSKIKVIRNVFIVFLISGFWHGANWTFIFWGGLNALYFLPLLLLNKNRKNVGEFKIGQGLFALKQWSQILLTFFITVIAWIFFRSETIAFAFDYIESMFTYSILSIPQIRPIYLVILIICFLIVEWIGKRDQYGLENFLLDKPLVIRWSVYYILILSLYVYGIKEQQFIYFQF
tara:strand:+ start:3825 stop:5261 length:1437 start_codon:yes stop_codon:yes gene_type:complete